MSSCRPDHRNVLGHRPVVGRRRRQARLHHGGHAARPVEGRRAPGRGRGGRRRPRHPPRSTSWTRPSVTACIDGVVADHGSLDVLVNNAGRGFVGTIEQVSMDEMREVMEVNFFGVVAATKAAMPHLRASGGRVITVTSVGGVVGQPFNEAYCAAKFAVEGFMESLAPVAATVGVHVSVIEPGPVATEFVNNVGVDVDRMFAEGGDYTPAMQGYLAHVMAEFADPEAAQTGDEVADVS